MELTYPRPNWAEVRWYPREDVPQEVADAAAQLSLLPGVTYHVGPEWTQLEVPRNCWTTEAWDTLASRLSTWAAIERAGYLEQPALTEPAQPLYEHQRVAARFLVDQRGGLLGDEMGLGKTRAAIVAADTIRDHLDPERPVVILAPGYTRDVWRRELESTGLVGERGFTAAFTQDPRHDGFNWDASWWFIHYDIAQHWQGFMALATGRRRLAVAILDEIHWVKNGRAKRSKAAAAIAGTAYARIGLSGTPLPNRPSELWWPLSIIDGKSAWGSPGDFRRRYCGATHDGYGLHDGDPTHVDELQLRLSHRYMRRTVDSAGVELPPLTRSPFLVEMQPKDIVAHDELMTEVGYDRLLEALLRGSAGQDTLSRLTKMRKLASKAKQSATQKLVGDMIAAGESVVVFTWQKRTAEVIARGIGNAIKKGDLLYGMVATVHGGHAQETRDACVREFQASEHPSALVATFGALREGVTLTRARHLIVHDLDWVPANILQAEARVYRIGQQHPTQITWMLAEHSIDVLIAQVLVAKSRAMQETLGIDAARDAVLQLDLPTFAGATSVETHVERLLAELGV